ncbi:MAG: hypothetical protein KDK99_00365 [Verrucomicrobiales bacterium]|nr:hypothetical protein [Verrucomicrobiales bacterium]
MKSTIQRRLTLTAVVLSAAAAWAWWGGQRGGSEASQKKGTAVVERTADELHAAILRLSVVSTDGSLDATELRRMAITQADTLQRLATEFERRFGKDERRAEVALLRLRLSALPGIDGKAGRPEREIKEELAKMAEDPDVPAGVRLRASRSRLVMRAREVSAGHLPLSEWKTEAQQHLARYPEKSGDTAIRDLGARLDRAMPQGGAVSEASLRQGGGEG